MKQSVYALCVSLLLLTTTFCSSGNSPDLLTNPAISDPSLPAKTESASAWNQAVGAPLACSDIDEVNIRFSEPGWVNRNHVGLFVKYIGVPNGEIKLNIWWDWENDPELLETVKIEDEDLRRNGDRLDLEKIIEHSYPRGTESIQRLVRVELTLKGRPGHCARNRHIFTRPTVVEREPGVWFVIDFEDQTPGQEGWTSPFPVTGTTAELHKDPGTPVEYARYSIHFAGDTSYIHFPVPATITWWNWFCAADFDWGPTPFDSGTVTVSVPATGGTIGRNGTIINTGWSERPYVNASCSGIIGHVTFQAPGVKTLRIIVQRP